MVRRRSLTGLIGSSHRHPLCAVPTASGGSSPAHYTEAKTRCAISAVYDAAAAAASDGSRSVYAAADSVLSTKYDAPTCLRVAADDFFYFPFIYRLSSRFRLSFRSFARLTSPTRQSSFTSILSIEKLFFFFNSVSVSLYTPSRNHTLTNTLYIRHRYYPPKPTHAYTFAGHELVVYSHGRHNNVERVVGSVRRCNQCRYHECRHTDRYRADSSQ